MVLPLFAAAILRGTFPLVVLCLLQLATVARLVNVIPMVPVVVILLFLEDLPFLKL